MKVIKYLACVYGDLELFEDPDWCIVHSNKRIPKQEICEQVKKKAIELLNREKAPSSETEG